MFLDLVPHLPWSIWGALAESMHVEGNCRGHACLTHEHMHAGVSPGLLFDWALPLLSAQQGSADSSKAADVGSMYWVMTALREGLQLCDDKTVSRYGHALFESCQALLESDDLSVHLLAPLLALLTQASCAPLCTY